MDESWAPALRLRDVGGTCRLSLVGLATGRGPTLQDAADDLIETVLALGIKLRAGGLAVSSELAPLDLRLLEFVQDVMQVAADGGDVRGRVFGLTGSPSRP